MNSLSRGEQKKLALHRALVERIRHDDARSIALRRIEFLRARNPHSRSYYDQWEELLSGPVDLLVEAMTGTDERCVALRQESPFGDLIDRRERARIYRDAAAGFDQAHLK